jgi:hypothetical protein
MNDASPRAVSASRVSPRLRRVAIAAFVVLLPLAAHSLWDYIEIRRLVWEIEAIRAKGAPVSEREAVGGNQPVPSKEHGAASYYLAGAMLALGTNPSGAITPIREWLVAQSPSREKLHQLAGPLHELVRNSNDALLLADKAAELPFDGFPAGTEYSYRTAGVSALSELITARTLTLSQSGDADAAVNSVISGLQIRRALRDARWMAISGHQVPVVLSLTQPSPQALVRLQTALESEDKPERQLEHFLRERARYVELIWRRYYGMDPNAPSHYTLPMRSVTETVMRPWFTHNAVNVLRLWAQLVEVAKTEWPDKARRSAAILDANRPEQRPSGARRNFNPLLDRGFPVGAFSQAVDATQLVVDRASRVAIAIERFRRDRNALPASLPDLVPQYLREIPGDPYSGRPLLFRPAKDGYTVYSVGPNQQDDQGDLSSELQRVEQQGWGRRLIRGTDVGVRVLIRND